MEFNTKQDFQKMLEKIVIPLKEYYSEDCARLNVGVTGARHGEALAGLEAFSRILWGLIPYWYGGGKNLEEFKEIYRKGFSSGANPKEKGYWGDVHAYDQRMVEMAAIGFGLCLVPEILWEPLSDEQKDNLANWLWGINEYKLVESNWQFFNVIVNIGLKRVGRKYSQEKMQYAFDCFEKMYLGEGWYSDGLTPQRDYYISFAIHYYSLLYAKFMEKEDVQRSNLYKERAMEFGKTFIYWFDEEGAALPFGRSLTYRFAQTSFWCACVFAGVEVFEMGVVKGIILRHLQNWFKRPIFDNKGILTIGYGYPMLNMAESYNASGSPYWALKSFIILAFDENSEFWKAEVEPMPKLDKVKLLKYAYMLMQRQNKNVMALTAGQYDLSNYVHTDEKYSKFAYSTHFGFCVPRSYASLIKTAPDSMLSFVIKELTGDMVFVRKKCMETRITENEVYSKWSPIKGIIVETILVPTDYGHIRKHIIESEYECEAYDSGFAVEKDREFFKGIHEKGKAEIDNGREFSAVESEKGEGIILECDPNTNLIFSQCPMIPSIRYSIKKGRNEITTIIKTKVY